MTDDRVFDMIDSICMYCNAKAKWLVHDNAYSCAWMMTCDAHKWLAYP